MRRLFALTALLFAVPAHAVDIEWVTVGDPGNEADTTFWGAVPYTYLTGKYEVTNGQYTEFLNAVADTDTYGLYNTNMADPSHTAYGYGGITRSGSSGSYTYSTIAGRGDMPVNYVSVYDTLRFANWLHNGQPTGAQDASTTEDGAYTMSLGTRVPRNAGATIFLPSENEWYKAAYYDAVSTSYFDYPAGTDVPTTCALPGAAPNTANCAQVVGDLTDVGSYTGSASPYGTFDQGGNVREWTERIFVDGRSVRGGSLINTSDTLAASSRAFLGATMEGYQFGFRVASLPENECIDALDNDGDGLIDFAEDPGCVDALDTSEKDDTGTYPCDDDVDNEPVGDGYVDYREDGSGDPGCKNATWSTESPQCQDGINNDWDGLTDFDGGQSIWGACSGDPGGCPTEVSDPEGDGIANPDLQCWGRPWNNSEKPNPRPCGLGAELALLLPPLMWLWRRTVNGLDDSLRKSR